MTITWPRDPQSRRVPTIPSTSERLSVVIDTDAKNEIDDQWALALAILTPERFDIKALVAAHFDNPRGGPDSVNASLREIETVLDCAGMSGRWPVLPGAQPMQYRETPTRSEGVDCIIDLAMAASQEEPLWVIGLGAATDMACAVLLEPRIIDRVIAFWHLRTRWPVECFNFNVFGDVRAARLLFHSPLPFVLFDTGTYLHCSMAESAARVAPQGDLGRYLHDYRRTDASFSDPKKGFFDLGDIAALVDPSLACWEIVDCPEVDWNLRYSFSGSLGQILRCYHVDRDRTFALLYDALETHTRTTSQGD